jgi:lipid-A-disaccharide synthase
MKRVFIIAGEASGDQLGAAVIRSLRARHPDVEIYGIGGPLMMGAGLGESLFPMKELSVMGLVEIVPHIPHFIRRINQTVDAIIEWYPDVVLTIDSPDFCFRVQKKLRQARSSGPLRNRSSGLTRGPQAISEGPSGQARGPSISQFHMVAPSVWAWRPGRAKKIAQFLDGLLCLFPFEPAYFTPHGLPSIAIGHPVVNKYPPRTTPRLAGPSIKIGLYLGSRSGVIHRHADIYLDAIDKLAQSTTRPIEVMIPTFPAHQDLIAAKVAGRPWAHRIITTESQKTALMPTLDLALAVSGTVGLELAVAGVPHVIGYRMGRVTHTLARLLVRRGQRAHLANIVLDTNIIPEFIQGACTATNLAQAMNDLLVDQGGTASEQLEAFERLRALLSSPETPGDRAVEFILGSVCRVQRTTPPIDSSPS